MTKHNNMPRDTTIYVSEETRAFVCDDIVELPIVPAIESEVSREKMIEMGTPKAQRGYTKKYYVTPLASQICFTAPVVTDSHMGNRTD